MRRLAALDMYGTAGTILRRRVILVEFIIGALACTTGGAWAWSVGSRWFGLWLIGIGLNYVPLAIHAIALAPAGRLEAELKGVDTLAQLKRYGLYQFALLIPVLPALVAAWQAIRHQSR